VHPLLRYISLHSLLTSFSPTARSTIGMNQATTPVQIGPRSFISQLPVISLMSDIIQNSITQHSSWPDDVHIIIQPIGDQSSRTQQSNTAFYFHVTHHTFSLAPQLHSRNLLASIHNTFSSPLFSVELLIAFKFLNTPRPPGIQISPLPLTVCQPYKLGNGIISSTKCIPMHHGSIATASQSVVT